MAELDGEKRTMQAVIGLHFVELGTLLQRGSLDPDATYPWRDRREIVETLEKLTRAIDKLWHPQEYEDEEEDPDG